MEEEMEIEMKEEKEEREMNFLMNVMGIYLKQASPKAALA